MAEAEGDDGSGSDDDHDHDVSEVADEVRCLSRDFRKMQKSLD